MAKLVTTPEWEAFDGKRFPTEAEAKAHEKENFHHALVGLTAEQVAAALARAPEAIGVADAIERAGTTIAAVRLAAGERKRARNGSKVAAHAGDGAGGGLHQVAETDADQSDPDELA